MDSKRIKNYIIFALVGIGFIVLIIFAKIDERKKYKEFLEEKRRIDAELEKDTARSEEEIFDRLNNAILADETDNVYIRVPGTFSQEEIWDIAHKVDPFLGRVTQVTYTTTSSSDTDEYGNKGPEIVDHFVGVNYAFEKSDDYRVYDAIVNGKSFSSDHTEAAELLKVCERFLKENITDGMSEYDKELAIHDFIVNSCSYSHSDNNDMTEYKAYGALVNHKAVCEGYSRATALLLKCCGIETNLISGHADSANAADPSNPDGGGSEDTIISPDGKVMDGHMWNQVKIDNVWYNLDTTWDDPLIVPEELNHTYFNVDDAILEKNHKWDTADAKGCTSLDANYYKKNGIYFESDAEFKDYIKNYLADGNRDTLECAVTNAITDEEAMSFIFEYEGIGRYLISTSGVDGYEIIQLSFQSE